MSSDSLDNHRNERGNKHRVLLGRSRRRPRSALGGCGNGFAQVTPI